jgi:hypothetical protein
VPSLEAHLATADLGFLTAASLLCIVPGHEQAIERVIAGLSDPDADGFGFRVLQVTILGPTESRLIPFLTPGLAAPQIAQPELVLDAIARIDPEAAVSALKALLDSADPDRQLRAMELLRKRKLSWAGLTQKLIVLGDGADDELAWAAAETLAVACDASEPALGVYARRLQSAEADPPGGFSEALGLLARSDAAVRALIRAVLAAKEGCLEAALDAVLWMGPAAQEMAPLVEGLASTRDRRVASRASEALSRLPRRGDPLNDLVDADLPAR